MAASACFFARWRDVSRCEGGASSGVGGDGGDGGDGGEVDEEAEEDESDNGEGCPASGSWSWSEDDGGGVVEGGGMDCPSRRLEKGGDGMAGGEVEGGGDVPAPGAGGQQGGCCSEGGYI